MNREDININTILLGVLIVLTGINIYMTSNSGSNIDLAPSNSETSAVTNQQQNVSASNPNTVKPQQPNQNQISTQLNDAKRNPQPNPGSVSNKPTTNIKFNTYEHDFGPVQPNTENKKIFTFTNTGDVPLFIENAKGSCGCTVPTFPKEPINPNETGEIEVVFKPKPTQKGPQTKTVTVTANTPQKNTTLTIKANVADQGQ